MTKQEILAKIQTNYMYALNFALDNNLSGVIDALTVAGFAPSNKEAAMSILMSLLRNDKQKAIRIISSVPYIDTQSNYTGGFKDFFMRTTPAYMETPQLRTTAFSWTGLMAGLGSGLQSYAYTSQAEQALNGGGFGTTPQQALANAEEEKKKEEEAAKKKKMWIWIGSIVGGIILILIIYFAFFKKKKTETKE